jgi:hypothetical protein
VFSTNRSHAIKNGDRNGIHRRRRAPILYKYVDKIIYLLLIITCSLAYSCGQQRNRGDKKCRQIDDNFNDHEDAAVLCRAHRLMKHNQGFTRSQWMLPSGKFSYRIDAAATMVDDFGRKDNH